MCGCIRIALDRRYRAGVKDTSLHQDGAHNICTIPERLKRMCADRVILREVEEVHNVGIGFTCFVLGVTRM